jgi:hypothetical protein
MVTYQRGIRQNAYKALGVLASILVLAPPSFICRSLARRNFMAQLNLTNQEVTTLLQILQSDRSDLSMEISNTDRKEFRDQLKETKGVILSIIAKLEMALPAESMEKPT